MLILYFHIVQKDFQVLNAIFQASVYVTIVYCHCVLQYVPLLENFFDILLVVELLVYSKKYFLI